MTFRKNKRGNTQKQSGLADATAACRVDRQKLCDVGLDGVPALVVGNTLSTACKSALQELNPNGETTFNESYKDEFQQFCQG